MDPKRQAMRHPTTLRKTSSVTEGRRPSRRLGLWLGLAALLLGWLATPGDAQVAGGAPEALERRASERLQALRREADALATEERTLLGDLRRLEIDRDMRTEELRQADVQVAEVTRALDDTTTRIADLERLQQQEVPRLTARLVQMYKLGRAGYARLLLDVGDLRTMGQAARMVGMMARRDREQVLKYKQTVASLQEARVALEARREQVAGFQRAARAARAAAERAAAARNDLIAQIDARRDLNAQLAAELDAARRRLQEFVARVSSATPLGDDALILPLRPFRGDLEWPVAGQVSAPFGQDPTHAGTDPVRNGVEIAAAEGSQVRAVHEGTIAFADRFGGFGNLVIVDHGSQAYSVYGNLDSIAVKATARVTRGTALGTVGASPSAGGLLYFELRIDGKPVDPIQWLKRRQR